MALDGQPRQDLQNVPNDKNLTPQAAVQRLKAMKKGARAPYWRQLTVEQVIDCNKNKPPSYARAMLYCAGCNTFLEASNISNLGKSHFTTEGHCKAEQKAAGVVPVAGPGSGGGGMQKQQPPVRVCCALAYAAHAQLTLT